MTYLLHTNACIALINGRPTPVRVRFQQAIAAGAAIAVLAVVVVFELTPIGAYDLLIAGQARQRSATLVTANAAEFARVAGLVWEDWAALC